MSAPNENEKELIKQFREDVVGIVSEELRSQDHFLLRWIRARDANLAKAKEMLQKAMKWRKENDIDNVLTSSVKSAYFEYNLKYWLHGHDKEGRPIMVPTGRWDIKKMVNDKKADQLMKEFSRVMEDTMRAIKASGKLKSEDYPVTQFVALCDWGDFAYGQITSVQAIQKLLDMVSHFEGYYPETVFIVILINCPRAFLWILPLIKTFMSGTTVDKLNVYGTDRNQWLPVVHKLIDADQLFPEYGGTSTFDHDYQTEEHKKAMEMEIDRNIG